MDIDSYVKTITTRQEFAIFVKMLYKDLMEDESNWDNIALSQYLESMSAYAEVMHVNYMHRKIEENADEATWKRFAQILLAATVYD